MFCYSKQFRDGLSDSTSNKKCGSTDRGGGTDLLYFETFETLANKYKSVPLDEGVRVHKSGIWMRLDVGWTLW